MLEVSVTLGAGLSDFMLCTACPSGELSGVPCRSGQLGGSGAGAPAAADGPRDPEPDDPGATGRQPPPADGPAGPGRSEGGALAMKVVSGDVLGVARG